MPATAGTALRSVRVASGLDRPVFVTAPPLDPNRLFIAEQGGLIRILDNGVLRPTPFLDLSGEMSCCNASGLLGMTFHPNYASNGFFFVNFTNLDGNTEVRRYHVSADPNVAEPASATTIIVLPIDPPAPVHNGGLVAFGPDGYLYVSMGDGGDGADVYHRAQDGGVLQGKLLRLDVNAATYTVPPSNPFVGAGPPLDEIWATGLRNPWRFSFDRGSGDLYLADVGQDALEEVNLQPAASIGGANYGWNVFEASACFEPPLPALVCPNPPTGFTFPVLEYDHSQGCSVTGGFVYRGCRLPDLRGTYFYSDFCTGFVRTFRYSGGAVTDPQDRTGEVAPGGGLAIDGVSSFGEDARGELYIVDYGFGLDGRGEVYRIEPAS